MRLRRRPRRPWRRSSNTSNSGNTQTAFHAQSAAFLQARGITVHVSAPLNFNVCSVFDPFPRVYVCDVVSHKPVTAVLALPGGRVRIVSVR